MSGEIVTEFVAAYTREFDYYQTAARLCSQRCEVLLGARGIRAIVTHRASGQLRCLLLNCASAIRSVGMLRRKRSEMTSPISGCV